MHCKQTPQGKKEDIGVLFPDLRLKKRTSGWHAHAIRAYIVASILPEGCQLGTKAPIGLEAPNWDHPGPPNRSAVLVMFACCINCTEMII